MTSIRMPDGTVARDPRLGRLKQFDERSKAFPVVRTLTAAQQNTPRSYSWTVGQWLNQGNEGACVGFGFSHELIAAPFRQAGITDQFAFDHYWQIQREDPWPGGAYEGADPRYDGTSVLSGAEHFKNSGYYSSYHWAFSEEELMLAVGYKGPAVIGVNWYEGMWDTNSSGFITPTGQAVGGHCTLIFSVNVRYGYYRIWNSWGANWGLKGTARITRADMKTLLAQDGEVCVPDKRLNVA